MQFVDHIDLFLQAGHGGAGSVSFRREKFIPNGGPDGGNGGNGGDIIFEATRNMHSLLDLKLRREYKAKNGDPGRKKNQSGLQGADLILMVPMGSLISDETGTLLVDLKDHGQKAIIAKGGLGGRGNANFSTSINRAPVYAQPGLPGQALNVHIELRMIAEIGLVGLPNSGKSTLLNTLTNAHSKVGDYPFTTLYPNLGVIHYDDLELLVADIPGLIEGASEGHGLGHDFLRHIDRTKIICHLVAVKDTPEETYEDYTIVRQELAKSEYPLLDKKIVVVLSKSDLILEEEHAHYLHYFKEKNTSAIMISAAAHLGLHDLKYLLYTLYQEIRD